MGVCDEIITNNKQVTVKNRRLIFKLLEPNNKSDNGIKVATLRLAIPRSFKNSDGMYDTDFIDCVLFDNVAENTSEYCKKGDIVGVKGRIQSRVIEDNDSKESIMET